MLRSRIDSSVIVIECTFSINLTALTLEQVYTFHIAAEQLSNSLRLSVLLSIAISGKYKVMRKG